MTDPAPAAQVSTARHLGQEALIVREKMEAMRSFESRLESDPHDAEALERLGMLQFEVGHTHESLRTFEKLVEASPLDPAGRFWLARVLDATGRKEDAAVERKIGARFLERLPAQAEPVMRPEIGISESGRPSAGPQMDGSTFGLPAKTEPNKAKNTEEQNVSRSRLRFGLEEALLLVASLGILVLFMNILVRI